MVDDRTLRACEDVTPSVSLVGAGLWISGVTNVTCCNVIVTLFLCQFYVRSG